MASEREISVDMAEDEWSAMMSAPDAEAHTLSAHWKREEAKPTKYNFTPDGADEYLSMQLADRVTPAEIFAKFPGIGLLEIETEVPAGKGLRVTYEPADGVDHVAVRGLKGPKNALRRELCELTVQLWEPGTSAPRPRRGSQVRRPTGTS